MKTVLRWIGYTVCWLGVILVLIWLGFVVYGISIVENWF